MEAHVADELDGDLEKIVDFNTAVQITARIFAAFKHANAVCFFFFPCLVSSFKTRIAMFV